MEKNREKLQKSVAPEKREKNKKYRLMEKEYQKRRQKYDDARLKVNNWVFSSIFAKILAYFDDFSKWSPKALQNFEKSSNMPKKLAKN